MLENKWVKKLIILSIVLCLIFSHCSVFAAGIIDLPQNNEIQKLESNIEISANISSNTVQNVNEYVAQIGEDGIFFSVKLKAKDGYMKNPILSIPNLDDEIFEIDKSKLNSEFIQSINQNEITISRLDDSEEVLVQIPIKLKENKYYNPYKTNSDIEFVIMGTFVNLDLKHTEISKSTSVKLGWNSKDEKINVKSYIEKSFSYISENQKYMLAQYSIDIGLDENSKIFPIESTYIDFEVPKNENLVPQTVIVDSKSTSFTNGLIGNDVAFNENNWKYENGIVSINVLNSPVEEESNKYIIPEGNDKYLITVTYLLSGKELEVTSNISTKVKFYNNGTTKEIENAGEAKYDLSKSSGSLVSYNVSKVESQISKGNIYANYNLYNNYYDTEYTNLIDVNISKADIVKDIQIKEQDEYFVDGNNQKYPTFYNNKNNTYYKTTSLKKENLDNILGENGSLSIYTSDGKKLITIDKSVEANEDGNIVINYNTKIGKIIIKINNPEKEGILSILNTKNIDKLTYKKATAIKFKKLYSTYNATSIYDTEVKDELGKIQNEINLKETKSSAVVSTGKKVLNTLAENKDVELKIALNNYNEVTDLYRNPVFEVTLPKEIEEVKVNSMNILYGNNEFSISNVEQYKDKKGNIVLRIFIKGMQTKYTLIKLTEGTNIILNLNIKVNIYTPSTTSKITMKYYNEDATNYNDPVPWSMDIDKSDNVILNANGTSEENISFIAPQGVVSGQKLSKYNDKNAIYSISQGPRTDRILTNVNKQVADSEIIVMNNSEERINNVSILGRAAFVGNKTISTNEDIGTNIDTKLVSEISEVYGVYKKFKIYYSSNPEATKDLNDKNNGWTEEFKAIQNIRSYLIVLDESINAGEIVTFSYNFEIPSNLGCDRKLYTTFNTFYTNEKGEVNSKEADIVGLETVTTPKITTKITSTAGSTVREGEIIEYTIKVKNEGETIAEDINFTFDIPKDTTYVKYIPAADGKKGYYKKQEGISKIHINIGDMHPEEEKVYTYLVEVNKNTEKVSAATVKATAEGMEHGSSKEKLSDTTEESKVDAPDMILTFGQESEGKIVREKYDLTYHIDIDNNTNISKGITEVRYEDGTILSYDKFKEETEKGEEHEERGKASFIYGEKISNIIVEQVIPKEVTFEKAYILKYNETIKDYDKVEVGMYDESTRTYKLNIDEIEADNNYSLTVVCKTNYIGDELKKDINSFVTVKAEGYETLKSKNIYNTIGRPNIETTFTSTNTNKYVKEKEKITYKLTAKNTGVFSAVKFTVTDILPKELRGLSGEYYLESAPSNVNKIDVITGGDIKATVNLEVNDTLVVKIVTEAKKISQKEKKIDNYVMIDSSSLQNKIKSDTVTNIIQRDEEKKSNKVNKDKFPLVYTQQNNQKNNYYKNKYKITGKSWMDTNKNGKRDQTEKSLPNIVVKLYNANTNKVILKQKTNSSGDYIFSNLSPGKYYIIFSFDTSKYALTKYQKKGVDNSLNSDAILNNSLAITDIITINRRDIGNIDIGLVNAPKFDMSLKKNISKITVYSNKGTRVYNYNNATFGKIDIKAKELSTAKVYMEYKITVKNDGEVAGSVRNIVDYIPKGTTFNTELNKGWYKNADGNIYNPTLKDTLIKPGERKTVKVVLVKQMTENNTGMISNSAEIAELYNEFGIEDVDSKVANGLENEDDFGTADIVISVKTGGLLINGTVIIICICLGIVCVYIFKKVVLERIRRW